MPNNAPTVVQISKAIYAHMEAMQEWSEYTNLNKP